MGEILLGKRWPFEDLAFLARQILEENLSMINVKFGGNVSNQYFKTTSELFTLPYEITDSILENTADCLIAEKTIENVLPWEKRIHTLDSFVKSVLSKNIAGVVMNINVDKAEWPSDTVILTCNSNDFIEKIDDLYSSNTVPMEHGAHVVIYR